MRVMARPQEFDTDEALRQAMRVFWSKGFEATSMADLLEATGLSKSSLYGAFGSKRDLFLAAFDAYREARAKDMGRILRQGPARDAIEHFFRTIITDARDGNSEGCMSINQAVELAPRDPDIGSRVRADFERMENALARIIQRGQQEGSIKSRGNPAAIARILVLAFPGFQVMVRAGCEKSRLDEGLTALLTILD